MEQTMDLGAGIHPIETRRPRWARLVCRSAALPLMGLLLALASIGCGGKGVPTTPVTFVAVPGAASLRVERLAQPDAMRGELVATGSAPLSTELELASPAASYRVMAEPSSEEARENFQATEVRYD